MFALSLHALLQPGRSCCVWAEPRCVGPHRQMLRAPVKAGDGWKIYPLESIHYYGDIELNDIPKQVQV